MKVDSHANVKENGARSIDVDAHPFFIDISLSHF